MRIDDDTVRACHAMRELMSLYDAYRATARAQATAIQQIRRHQTASGAQPDARRTVQLAQLSRREALAGHTDAVFAERREQIRRRLYELQGLPVLP